jgi:hypothetical protein
LDFKLQRFRDKAGKRCSYFDFKGDFSHGYISEGLWEYSSWLSLNSSYEHVEAILDRQTGAPVLSSGKIQRLVVQKALMISQEQCLAVQQTEHIAMPPISTSFDLYSCEEEELIVFEDGILVKGQKTTRKCKSRPVIQSTKKEKTFQSVDMAEIRDKEGQKKRLIGGIGLKSVALTQVMAAHVKTNFTDYGKPLRVVAITDGATSIRLHLESVFGPDVIRILDWFHLKKKVNEMCITVCLSQTERKVAAKKILHHCWVGKVDMAIKFLKQEVKSRNQVAFEKLNNYLDKHTIEMVDYEKRQKLGKCIGSGEIETTVKQAVASRQKTKGMSWSEQGSKALAILKCHHLNKNWEQIWN